ncbi:MAG: hypothetical protein U0167_07080 [bacterium]
MRRNFSFIAALLGLLMMAAPVSAVDSTYPVSPLVWITGPNGNSRALLGFTGIGGLSEEWIISAHLKAQLAGTTPVGRIPLEVWGLARAWDAGATWTSPWTTPGADRALGEIVTSEVPAGVRASSLDVDVTDLIRSMASGDALENGFLLAPAIGVREGFTGTDRTVLGNLQGATIEVTYRKLTADGISGGMRQLLERKHAARAEGGHGR